MRKKNRDTFTFIEWFFKWIFPTLFIFMLIFAVGAIVFQVYLATVVGIEIHENGLKSVVDSVWNGTK